MLTKHLLFILLILLSFSTLSAEMMPSGFFQTLWGASLESLNPAASEYTALETRLQLRLEHLGEIGEFFGRIDFLHDSYLNSSGRVDLREGYAKFPIGDKLDFKIGRQIITWGTGDLLFINDVFAKDYLSFFIGRDDQYLKAPQNSLKADFYNSKFNLTFVWTPKFTPNDFPIGQRLSFYSSQDNAIVGNLGELNFLRPEPTLKNSEIAFRLSKQIGNFSNCFYFYEGFYKNPVGAVIIDSALVPTFPKLRVMGGSIRGMISGGIFWFEGGYYDTRDENRGQNPLLINSSTRFMTGYEKQILSGLTMNLQYFANIMSDYDSYRQQAEARGGYVREKRRDLITSRISRLFYSDLVEFLSVIFYSPSEKDYYLRFYLSYSYSDELNLSSGGNIFGGDKIGSEFGQFGLNDNLYVKLTYGF